jgi:tetratricopeptide (TPR) repeat protein
MALGFMVALAACLPAWAQVEGMACGSLQNGYGPYDYRTDKPKLPIVDGAHFTPAVEALIRGSTSSVGPGTDLDYTLRAFPNHHRALVSVMNYGEKVKPKLPRDLPRTVECYFERALRFRPDDFVARMIYATYLAKNKRESDASKQLDLVATAANDNAFTFYNVGLIYFDMKNYGKALEFAHKAYGLGFGSTDLRDQLKKAGKWTEPEPKSEAAETKPVVVDEKR